jgi:hypothetical protein
VTRSSRTSTGFAVVLALALCCVTTQAAKAADDITASDLDAVAHAIGFLDSLPDDGTIVVGIVYADSANSKAKAAQTSVLLTGMQGPSKAHFRTVLIAAKDIARTAGRLDAVILMPNQTIASSDIANAVRRRHLVSISTDAGCIDAQCCVLMVNTTGRVRIVLNTELADVVGARFSSIFMMMVERK